jgi:hypothetical protein
VEAHPRLRDEKTIEWYIDVVDRKPPRPLDLIQRDLSHMGFSELFVKRYAELRWELVDGISTSLIERMN